MSPWSVCKTPRRALDFFDVFKSSNWFMLRLKVRCLKIIAWAARFNKELLLYKDSFFKASKEDEFFYIISGFDDSALFSWKF